MPLRRSSSRWDDRATFDTGVEGLPDQPARLTGEKVPQDDGFGRPGDGTFNVPPLVEAADTGPLFHNNAIETIEGAVGFYNGAAFNNSLQAASWPASIRMAWASGSTEPRLSPSRFS